MRIAVYTDDPPISEAELASGMNRVNRRLFLALKENISTMIISHQHGYHPNSHLEKELIEKIVSFRVKSYFIKIIRKFDKLINKYLNVDFDLLFYMNLSKMIKLLKESQSDFLFVPLGADIRSYKRAIILSKKSELPLVTYIVDEFMSSSILSKDKFAQNMCKKNLKNWLYKTKKIFVISEGMEKFLLEHYNLNSVVLNLPFEKKYEILNCKPKNNILFLGNTSHFYQDGLKDLLQVIFSYNQVHKDKIYLRLTVEKLPDIFDEKYTPYIRYSKIEGDEKLAKEINSSLFCFIPYSFDEKYKSMVSTSFPSKTLECLAYSKNIVIYGPEYSSSVNYFKKNNLKTFVTINSEDLLKRVINDICINYKDLSELYTVLLKKSHGYDTIKTIFLNNLKKKKVKNII